MEKDEEMKVDEPASSSAAPVVDGAAAVAAKPKRKAEATSGRLANLSRVTSAQLAYISFPAESRYVPVRSFAASTPSTSAVASTSTATATAIRSTLKTGGGILMMRDREPTKEAEFLEMEVTRVLQVDDVVPVDAPVAAVVPVDDGPIAEMPAAFEYSDWD